jgi:putative MATE family efflux protein
MVVAASYTIVDAIFIGRLGPEALGALSVVFPLMLIYMAVSMGTGVGAASLISRRFGAGDHEGANRAAGGAVALAILIGALLAVIYLANLEGLLHLFGAIGPVMAPAKSYMSILATFAFLHSSSLILSNVVRAGGSPLLSGAAMVISAVVNIALDPILIFGWGPIPSMGVAGAATATIVGQGTGVVVYVFHFLSQRTSFRFKPSYFFPNPKIVAEIYRVGLASIVRMGSMSVVMAIANTQAAAFGVIPLAVLGLVFRLARFAFMPTMGLGQGMLPLVGFNFGASKKERVGEVVIKAGFASFVWGFLCWSVFMLFPSQVIVAFNDDPRLLTEGVRALRIFVLLFFGVQLQIIISFFFQGTGKGVPSLILSSARQVIFLIPGLLILPGLLGLTGLWVAFPLADALSILLTLIWTGIEFNKQGIRFRLRYGRALE